MVNGLINTNEPSLPDCPSLSGKITISPWFQQLSSIYYNLNKQWIKANYFSVSFLYASKLSSTHFFKLWKSISIVSKLAWVVWFSTVHRLHAFFCYYWMNLLHLSQICTTWPQKSITQTRKSERSYNTGTLLYFLKCQQIPQKHQDQQ